MLSVSILHFYDDNFFTWSCWAFLLLKAPVRDICFDCAMHLNVPLFSQVAGTVSTNYTFKPLKYSWCKLYTTTPEQGKFPALNLVDCATVNSPGSARAYGKQKQAWVTNHILDLSDQRNWERKSHSKAASRYKEVNCATIKGMKAARQTYTEGQCWTTGKEMAWGNNKQKRPYELLKTLTWTAMATSSLKVWLYSTNGLNIAKMCTVSSWRQMLTLFKQLNNLVNLETF